MQPWFNVGQPAEERGIICVFWESIPYVITICFDQYADDITWRCANPDFVVVPHLGKEMVSGNDNTYHEHSENETVSSHIYYLGRGACFFMKKFIF